MEKRTVSEEKQETPKEETTEEPTREEQLEEQLRRVHADYQNYRRRTEQQQETIKQRAAETLIKEILSVTDNLELAISQASEDDGLYKGVELVLGQLTSVLEDQGVQKIPTNTFDPNLHEAIMSSHSEQAEGEIIEVLQQGYMLAGKPLRTTKVKVSKGPQLEENTQ